MRRTEQAEYARDAKRDQEKCSFGGCMASHGLQDGPDGWIGQYGGSKLCDEHMSEVVDRLLASLEETGRAPWEDE